MVDAGWEQAARRWIAVDPDPHTRAQVQAWLDAGDAAALREAFGATLSFGTGGLRGEMGPGTARVNRLQYRRAAAAWAEALLAADPTVMQRGLAIAYDARQHSDVYASDVARVLVARGIPVHIAPEPVPTPVLSFATAFLGLGGGAIVTASHNPPADNGFKVFDAAGAQILAPLDTDIAARMAAMDDPGPLAPPDDDGLVPWPDRVREAFFAGVLAQRVQRPDRTVRIAFTPLHGVGGAWTPEALRRAGHTDLHAVPSQIAPDGAFPTVSFPNPEEPGALDALRAHAEAVGADLALANDPDADRLAVMVRHGGDWVMLSGNEVGALLGEVLLAHGASEGAPRQVATTIVSTALLSRVAEAHGASCVETLTGFKWIAASARRFEASGGRFVLGMEESIGYSVGSLVRDKDGVGAAVIVADLAATLAAQGRTLVDALETLFAAHGRHVARTVSLRVAGLDGLDRMKAAMAALRATPPSVLAGTPVASRVDVLAGTVTAADGNVLPLDLPASDVLGFTLAGGGRAWVRPSGTEPKLKIYAEVVVSGDRAEGEARLDALLADLRARTGLDA